MNKKSFMELLPHMIQALNQAGEKEIAGVLRSLELAIKAGRVQQMTDSKMEKEVDIILTWFQKLSSPETGRWS